MPNKILYSPKEGTSGFFCNGVEIVNGAEIIGQFRYHTSSETILNPGDLLDIPIGYEFREEEKCLIWCGLTKCLPINGGGCRTTKVLRLVKTETKDPLTFECKDENCPHCNFEREFAQPEPEESQKDLLYAIRTMESIGAPDEAILQRFIIQRKKQ